MRWLSRWWCLQASLTTWLHSQNSWGELKKSPLTSTHTPCTHKHMLTCAHIHTCSLSHTWITMIMHKNKKKFLAQILIGCFWSWWPRDGTNWPGWPHVYFHRYRCLNCLWNYREQKVNTIGFLNIPEERVYFVLEMTLAIVYLLIYDRNVHWAGGQGGLRF